MSIPREGSRDTDKGILVSCVPDWCWVQCGTARVLTPFRIYAKQKDDANTAPTVRQTGKRSHTSGSIITVCHGDEPGNGLGVKSGTKESVCWPITWSPTVRIEGKHAVRHNDLWAMNNGNTVGKLAYTEDVQVYEKPEHKVESELPSSDKKSEEKTDILHELDVNSGDVMSQAISGDATAVNAFGTADSPSSILNPDITNQINSASGAQNTFGPGTQFAQPLPQSVTDVAPATPQTTPGTSQPGTSPPYTPYQPNTGVPQLTPANSNVGSWVRWGVVAVEAVGATVAALTVGWLLAMTSKTADGTLKPGPAPQPDPEPEPKPGPETATLPDDQKGPTPVPVPVPDPNMRVTRPRKDNPCWHLACIKTGKYNGGAHACMKEPWGDGLESHHTPARAAVKAASTLSPEWAPAIQMDPLDHRRTASNGSVPGHGNYIAAQEAFISSGNFMGATAMDVDDIKSKFEGKYNIAIAQMMAYTKCLKENGLIN